MSQGKYIMKNLNNRKGYVAIWVAFLTLVLVGMGGLSIDCAEIAEEGTGAGVTAAVLALARRGVNELACEESRMGVLGEADAGALAAEFLSFSTELALPA